MLSSFGLARFADFATIAHVGDHHLAHASGPSQPNGHSHADSVAVVEHHHGSGEHDLPPFDASTADADLPGTTEGHHSHHHHNLARTMIDFWLSAVPPLDRPLPQVVDYPQLHPDALVSSAHVARLFRPPSAAVLLS